METAAAAALAIIMGMRKGETLLGPFTKCASMQVSMLMRPPTPVPIHTPTRSGSGARAPASSSASAAHARANWVNRSWRRISLALAKCGAGSKPATVRRPFGGSVNSPAKKSSCPTPQAARTPRPVTTTRRRLIPIWPRSS